MGSALPDMDQKLENYTALRGQLLAPRAPQGPKEGYLDKAIFLADQNPITQLESYGMRDRLLHKNDYLVGGSSQLEAALNMTTGSYMGNERSSVIPYLPSRTSNIGYSGSSNNPYDTC